MNNNQFCHLHVHNQYSLLDGFGKAKGYTERAKKLGFDYLALTNHGNVDGLIKFQSACEESGIKPVFGCEGYIVPDAHIKEKGEKRFHIVLLVKNKAGWQNLLQLLTYANMEGFYYRPRFDYKSLFEHLEGLVLTTACTSSFLFDENYEVILADICSIIPGDVYLEIMPHELPDQIKLNRRCFRLSKKFDLPMVATNDCHYILEEDSKAQEVLLAIQYKSKWKDPKRRKFEIQGLHLRTADEMLAAFGKQNSLPEEICSQAMGNTLEIAGKCCDFRIEKLEVHLPRIPGYEMWEDKDLLKKLCDEGMAKRKFKGLKEYEERYKEEFGTITTLGFARYFLIVWELINWCKETDIFTGPGRGSVGGCLIAYLLGITGVDPLKFGLLFSRFISPARIDLPDIDMDFEDIKRGKVRQHLEDLYGEHNVAGVSTFLTLKGRAAIRDVSRVFDVPLVDVNAASKAIVVRSGGDFRSDFTIEDAFNTFEDGKRFKEKYPEVTKLAMKLEGQIRGGGMHAAAVVISKESLHEGKRGNLGLRKGGLAAINWGKEDTEHVGLMKLDVLGLNALTILNSIRKAVKQNHGVDLDYESLPLDDPKIYEEFTAGHNVGCFQFGSLGLRKMCQELGIDNFDLLVAVNALYRPGTLRSGMHTEFIMRKTGQQEWSYIHPFLEELTSDTFGIILYQEQVMIFMYELGGLGWKTADTVRKVISKSKGVEQFQKFRQMFIDGCKEKKTLDAETAGELWDQLASFGSYGFNKAHSVEYSMIAYWQMWLKIYYPAEFFCSSLTYGSNEKKEDLIEEAKRLGLQIMLPKIGVSKPAEWVTLDDKLYIPFSEIKSVGQKTVQKLEDLQLESGKEKEIVTAAAGKKMGELLEKLGCFDQKFDPTETERDRLKNFFTFEISKDPMKRVKGIYDWLKKDISFERIKEVDFGAVGKKQTPYFGQMTEIKYGYRGKIDTLEKKLGISGVADSLGGVYGNFKDDTDFAMLVFNKGIYSKKKDSIEHCSGEWLVAFCNQPSRANSLMCQEAWIGEELFEGKLAGLNLHLAELTRAKKNKEVLTCQACELRESCSTVVPMSSGGYNMMIIGEAPGRQEDKEGTPFVGDAGDLLWEGIVGRQLSKRMFYVSNVVKCWPKGIKTPGKKHIKTCSHWLEEEIAAVKPFLILAFGNTCMKFFKDQDSGIMEMNGKTEWSPKYNAWICWCIHPAAVLYHRENMELFNEGLDNFSEKVNILGGI